MDIREEYEKALARLEAENARLREVVEGLLPHVTIPQDGVTDAVPAMHAVARARELLTKSRTS